MRFLLALAFMAVASAATAADADHHDLKIYGMEARPIMFSSGAKPDGLAVELAREMQRCAGSRETIEIIPWARANALAASKPNVLLLSIVPTPERSGYLRFVGPIFSSHTAGYALRGKADELRARDPGLHTLHAGGRRGSVFVSQARANGFNLTDETNTSDLAARMLMTGRFDLWFESEVLVKDALERAGYAMHDVARMVQFPPHPAYFAFSAGTPESLVQTWDRCLRQVKRDGAFQRIHRKWLPENALP
jgi:polar amino acid transport system substrate-binding protein